MDGYVGVNDGSGIIKNIIILITCTCMAMCPYESMIFLFEVPSLGTKQLFIFIMEEIKTAQ